MRTRTCILGGRYICDEHKLIENALLTDIMMLQQENTIM